MYLTCLRLLTIMTMGYSRKLAVEFHSNKPCLWASWKDTIFGVRGPNLSKVASLLQLRLLYLGKGRTTIETIRQDVSLCAICRENTTSVVLFKTALYRLSIELTPLPMENVLLCYAANEPASILPVDNKAYDRSA